MPSVTKACGAASGYNINAAPFGNDAWSNPTNIDADDNSYALSDDNSETQGLATKSHGFAIPTGATIAHQSPGRWRSGLPRGQ